MRQVALLEPISRVAPTSKRSNSDGVGAVTDVACPNIGTEASGHPGELLWHYEDLNGIEYGPFPETRMRKWWLDRGFGPDLLVRLPTWTHFLKLHTLYNLGVPPTWKPTTVLSEYRRRPPPHAGTDRPPHEASAAPASSSRRSPLPAAATNPGPHKTSVDAVDKPDKEAVKEAQSVPKEPVHVELDEDDDEEQPMADYDGPDDDAQILTEKEELPEPKTAPNACAPDGAADDRNDAPGVPTEAQYAAMFENIRYPKKDLPRLKRCKQVDGVRSHSS